MKQQVSIPTQPNQAEQKSPDQPGQTNVDIGILNRFSNSIIEDVNVWLNVLDTDLNIVLWNHFAEAVSGYSHEEVIGHNLCWNWLYPDEEYFQMVTSRTAALMERDGGLDYFETRIRCKNGDLKTILWNTRSLVDENGIIFGAITFGYDITDRKKAEEALQKANNEISALFHIASVASASLDLDTILESSLECVLETMNSDKGFVHLWDKGNEALRLAANQGLSPELSAKIDEVPSGKGFCGWVYFNSQPMLIPNLMLDTGVHPAILSSLDYSYVGVPMRAKGKVVGVFSVLGQTGRQFRPDEVTLLTSIADQVGVAVENARLYQQAEQLAIMEERERLANDLHDSVTQSLYSLTLLAEASRRLIGSRDLERASEYITRLGETAQEALKEIRLLVYKLRPPALEREGLVGAIQQRLGAVERRAGVKAHLIANDTIQLSSALEEGLYRITQEALNNSLKHSKANSVTVRIMAANDHIELDVEDNGIGMDPETVDSRGGIGMASMQERAKRLGGTMQVHSVPGRGTRVSVRVKINPV